MNRMTIGQVARRAGIGVETIRFYERQGLISDPPRRPSGYRQYSMDVVRQLRFIRRAKELGFSLREIADLLDLRTDSSTPCRNVRRQLEAKIADVEKKIADLRHIREALDDLTRACASGDPRGACPILDALARTPWEGRVPAV